MLKDLNLSAKKYTNGISVKFDNRRITTWQKENTIGIEFRIISPDPKPTYDYVLLRKKLHILNIGLSPEGAEVLLLALADTLGFNVTKRKN